MRGILGWRYVLPPPEPHADAATAVGAGAAAPPEPPRPAVSTRRCNGCEVTWEGTAGSACWACGQTGTDY